MIVVDASVLTCALLDVGEDGVRVRRRLAQQDLVAVAEGTDVVVGQALGRLVATDHLRPERAEQALADLVDLPLERVPQWPFLPRAWQLREHLQPVQAVTAAVAEGYGVPLLTAEHAYERVSDLRCPLEVL